MASRVLLLRPQSELIMLTVSGILWLDFPTLVYGLMGFIEGWLCGKVCRVYLRIGWESVFDLIEGSKGRIGCLFWYRGKEEV